MPPWPQQLQCLCARSPARARRGMASYRRMQRRLRGRLHREPGSSWDQSARSPARARRILASSQHQQRIRHKKQRARLAERASEQRKWRCVGAGSRLHSARTQERARSGIACFALFVHVKCCNVVGALEGHNPKSPPQSSLYNTHVRYRLYQADS